MVEVDFTILISSSGEVFNKGFSILDEQKSPNITYGFEIVCRCDESGFYTFISCFVFWKKKKNLKGDILGQILTRTGKDTARNNLRRQSWHPQSAVGCYANDIRARQLAAR